MRGWRSVLIALVALTVSAPSVYAEVPGLLHYQGYLTDVEGTPVSGVWTVTFSFFEEQVGGEAFFGEAQVVEPDVGVFSVVLGSQPGNGIDPVWFSGGEAWLELTVDDGVADPVVLQPRQRVTSHPYAMWTDSAATCGEATNALGLGGAPAESYALTEALTSLVSEEDLPALLEDLGYLPGGGDYGDEDVQAYLDLLGIVAGAGYSDDDVAAYLLLNGYEPGPYFDGDYMSLENLPDLSGYLTAADLADFVVGDELLDQVAASGLFLMADGSVVASGDLDFGGYQLLDVVIENAAAPDAPEDPAGGQLWFDTDEGALKVYDGGDWVALGAATDFSEFGCDGCVDPEDVSFGYAGANAQGGAAFSSMGLVCDGCVTLGHITADVTNASSHGYDNAGSGLDAVTVQAAIDELSAMIGDVGPGSVVEGNGTIVPYVEQWGLPSYGTATTHIHLLNPAQPKVVMYLYAGENSAFTTSNNLVVAYDFTPNQYSASVSGNAGETALQVGNPSIFNTGSHVLIQQIIGTGGNGAGGGDWELNQVVSVQGSTLQLVKPLEHTYVTCGNDCGRAQAVVAASYNQLEIVNGGVLRPTSELDNNGTAGGVVYVRAKNIIVKNGGKITADGAGFYGGHYAGPCQWGSYCGIPGDSYCNTNPTSHTNSANCNGGGGADVNTCGWQGGSYCNNPNPSGGGGGSMEAGDPGSTGWNGYAAGSGGLETDGEQMIFGGGGGGAFSNWCQNDRAGDGGGIVVLGSKSLIVETGGQITANGTTGSPDNPSCYSKGFPITGSGGGGMVKLFTDSYQNEGTVEAAGGAQHDGNYSTFGGKGGDGWVVQEAVIPGVVNESFAKGVQIWVDGVDITAQLGDPNGKGAPHWDAAEEEWGADGLTQWSTGPLDITGLANWTLGEHSIELKETGGAGGDLKMYVYVIYPFTASTVPANNTCAAPVVLDVMSGSVVTSGTTEDTMGKIKATDDSVQAFCGGSGGPDVAYQFTLTEWRNLTIDVNAPFEPRVYIRRADCAGGEPVACGGAHVETGDLKSGTYYLFVDGDGNLAKGNFTLSITAEEPGNPSNDTCAAPKLLTFVDGQVQQYGVSLFSDNDYFAGCGGDAGPDNVYQFDVPPGTSGFTVQVDTDFDPVIYLSKGACGSPFIACAPSDQYTMGWPEAGTYYLVVDGKTADDKGEYTVSVTLQQ